MARYKPVDRSRAFCPWCLQSRSNPERSSSRWITGHLVDYELDFSALDARFNNDETGASAYDPRVMLKIVLLACSRGLISSRSIERACAQNVQFMALSGDAQPSYTHIANYAPRDLRAMFIGAPSQLRHLERSELHTSRGHQDASAATRRLRREADVP